jgi:Helitron helicase-like domain at N-terminus
MLAFDLIRRRQSLMKTNIYATRQTWPETERLLLSLTPERLVQAAKQAESHQPIEDDAVRTLLKMVSRVGSTAAGSDDKKFHMLTQLKSSVVRHGCPTIFLTLNPAERHSPLALYYAGQQIDIDSFFPENYSSSGRLELMLKNPLAVVEYFHTTVDIVINTLLKGGIFGELAHYYGTIEYQGRGTPHTHLLV